MYNAPSGAIGHCTESGWTDEESFMKWLQHFSSIVKPSLQEKHIINLDGHHSHKTLQAVEFSNSNGIDLLTLPPHCTHKMQPLDRTFFKALKSAYNVAADTWMVTNRGKRITFYQVAELFAVAYNKSATIEKSVKGFRMCGLWPFNDNIFMDEDFVDLAVDEHSIPPSSISMNRIFQGVQQSNLSQLNQQSDQHLQKKPESIVSHEKPSSSTYCMRDHIVHVKQVLFDLRTNKQAVPNNKSERRASEKSQLITSSPYKKMLQEKYIKNSSKRESKNMKKNKITDRASKKHKKTNYFCDNDSEEETWPCLVCGEPFSNSKPGEKWIQCNMCKHWSHEECTSRELMYVCYNCNSDDEL